jgi:hypothetical protein
MLCRSPNRDLLVNGGVLAPAILCSAHNLDLGHNSRQPHHRVTTSPYHQCHRRFAMSEPTTSPNKRRARQDDAQPTLAEGRWKRRAFLQTMGQQLREFGTDGTSPRDLSRTAFGTSPSSQCGPAVSGTTTVQRGPAGAGTAHIDTPESDAAPGEDDQLPAGAAKSASKWLWSIDEVSPMAAPESGRSFTFEDLLGWSQSYFDHWHPSFPFIHAPSLLEYFRQVAQSGSSSNDSAAFMHTILRSVVSISLMDRRQMASPKQTVPSSIVFHTFNDAINSIQRVLTEESSILSLQALISVQLFLITMHRYNAASRLEGLAVRIAFQLGLHRCPVKLNSLPVKECELRKRLFWSIFCIDRYICIRLGTPLSIRMEDVDVCYPHGERHDLTEQEETGLWPILRCTIDANLNAERDDRLDLLEFLSHHADVRGSIMELRNRSTLKDLSNEDDQALDIDAEHSRWWNIVDEYLSNAEQTQTITKAHQVTLIVLRFESILALHRSILATSKKSSFYNAALQRCISASRSIINTLHSALRGYGAFDGSPGQDGYETTPLLWPSFTWAVWMGTFIVIFAATEDQIPRSVACR